MRLSALVKAMFAAAMPLYANTQAVCNSFKTELMNGHHAFGTSVVRAGTGADSFKAALYVATATINASTTAYSATGEVSGAGYTAGGITITNATPPANTAGTTYWTPSASFDWPTVTLSTSFDCVLIYNDTQADKAVASYTFTAQTVAAANFSLTMPTNNQTTGLLRLT